MHLEIKLRDGRSVRVEVPEGSSLKDALGDLLNHTGIFEADWIALGEGDLSELVRYTEIVSVKPVAG